MKRNRYERLGWREFGRRLLLSQDLDSIYVMLARSDLDDETIARWILGFVVYDHAGAAARIAQADDFWFALARNRDRLPRGSVRYHNRGVAFDRQIEWFRSLDMTPLEVVRDMTAGDSLGDVIRATKRHRGMGDYFAMKMADFKERVFGEPMTVAVDDVLLLGKPDAAIRLVADSEAIEPTKTSVFERIVAEFAEYAAPPYVDPAPRSRRPVPPVRPFGPMEAETVLCKWKSHMNGRYPVCCECLEYVEDLRIGGRLGAYLAGFLPVPKPTPFWRSLNQCESPT